MVRACGSRMKRRKNVGMKVNMGGGSIVAWVDIGSSGEYWGGKSGFGRSLVSSPRTFLHLFHGDFKTVLSHLAFINLATDSWEHCPPY